MKSKTGTIFFIHFAVYASNHLEFLRFENELCNKIKFYHDHKSGITKARGRDGWHCEYSYRESLRTIQDVLALGMALGAIKADIRNGIHVEIEIK
jgi:hypothetical protein